MRQGFTEEQRALRETVRGFFADHVPLRRAHEIADGTAPVHDPRVWRRLAVELGVVGLNVDERHGGGGYGLVEQQIVLEEAGRALYSGPLLSSALAVGALQAADPDGSRSAGWLASICAGEAVAALALTGADGRLGSGPPAATTTSATPDGDRWRLDGVHSFVLDGSHADLVLVVATGPDGAGLFAVEGPADGVRRRRQALLDATRDVGEVVLEGAAATRLGDAGPATLRRITDLAVVALAAEQVGGASACLDMTVAYVRQRHQFGRPVGSFQAVKHRLADVHVAVESARSIAYRAAGTATVHPEELSADAAVAGAFCAEAFTAATAACVQLHGGIGFTWEHDAHLYLKRATCTKQLLGDPVEHRGRLAALAGMSA